MDGIKGVKKYWVAFLVAFLIATSWIGFIDEYAYNYTHDSILQAGGAYAVSRGLNAAISVAQSGTIQGEVGFIGSVGGSVAIGEALDPLNDLVERFSEIVTIALGSLALQAILLEIASNILFKVIVTLSGVAVIALLWLKNTIFINQVSKIFLLSIFMRLSFAIVLSINAMFDYAFTYEKIEQSKSELEVLETGVKESNENKADIKTHTEELNGKIVSMQSEKEDLQADLTEVQADIKEVETKNDEELTKLDFTDRIKCKTTGICPENIAEANSSLESLQNKEERLVASIKAIENKINDYQNQVSENEQILSGDIPWSMSIKNAKISISKIQRNFANGISNIINLLTLFILKTILLPVGFLYGVIKVSKFIWNHDWRKTMADYNKAIEKL